MLQNVVSTAILFMFLIRTEMKGNTVVCCFRTAGRHAGDNTVCAERQKGGDQRKPGGAGEQPRPK